MTVRTLRRNMRGRVRAMLLEEVTSGRLAAGERLAPIKTLAQRSGASFRTVQLALLDLQAQGFVELRHGAGTFVTETRAPLSLDHTVALCIETQGHIMHEFSQRLTTRLHDLGQMPMTIDASHGNALDMIRRLARAGTGVFVAQARLGRPFPISDPALHGKLVIGVMDWADASTLAQVVTVLVHHRLGGELVARHLHDTGHRHVLLAGPESMLHSPNHHAAGFVEAWRRYGGRCDTLAIRYDADERQAFDAAAAMAQLRGPGKPTAVFGLRDFDICSLAASLAAHGFAFDRQYDLIGYGNTPWSSGGLKGFSSVDWNINAMVEKVCGLVEDAADGHPPAAGTCVWIQPRLVLRKNEKRTSHAQDMAPRMSRGTAR